ncbi:MAG: UDP-galactopyranose mutase [Terriglobales bacterium]
MKPRWVVVGAGFSGATLAQQIASRTHEHVLVLDRRGHIGGNAYDEYDAHGILVHRYGPHIFHTNAARVFQYLSQFTQWRPYEHRVLARVEGQLLPVPINRTTVNRLYGLDLDEAGVAAFYERVREPRIPVRTSEDLVIGSIGRDLFEKFFRGYTRKQWGLDASQLAASVAARIPYRSNDDDRYFTDDFQFMPAAGYTALFRSMLDHPSIRVELGVDFQSFRRRWEPEQLIYTGPIDEYFGNCFGPLAYRSLRFEFEHFSALPQFQAVGQVNYPNDHDFTRITEFKHLTGQTAPGTTIAREYPCADGEPYYPVPLAAGQEIWERYHTRASAMKNVHFVGRLAQYRYYNMDQAVAAALKAADSILSSIPERKPGPPRPRKTHA